MANQSNLFGTYNYPAPQFVRGRGAYLYDSNDNEYLDFSSGIAVNALGHSHPHLVEVLKNQAENLWHTSNLFAVPGREKLAKRLCDNSFADKVFFTNSGGEAMECSIKTARRYQNDTGNENKVDILTFEGAFHGRTLATIAATGKQQYLEGFGPKTLGFEQYPYADKDAISNAITENTAAILIEPTMGEGGIRQHTTEYLAHLRNLCDEHGLLLIFDEIQTGIARTGKLFAYQWSGVEPDIMALAKGLGGGFPVGACLARDWVAKYMVPGTHGSTFAGNPLAMAAANGVLDIVLEDGFLDRVNAISSRLQQNLAEYLETYPDVLEEIRGEGLLLGLKCKIPNTDVVTTLREAKVLVAPAGDNVVRLLPPLVMNDDELADAHKRMSSAFDTLQKNTQNEEKS